MSFSTPIAKVRGLGSAKSGSHHWIAQRFTAIALVPLSLWFICSLVGIGDMSYQKAIEWIMSPMVAVLLLLFIITLFHHAQLGLQVVIEDYLICKTKKITSLIILKLASLLTSLATAIAILKIYLGS